MRSIHDCLTEMEQKCAEMQSLNQELFIHNQELRIRQYPGAVCDAIRLIVVFNSNVCRFMQQYNARICNFLNRIATASSRDGPSSGAVWLSRTDFGERMLPAPDQFQADERRRQMVLMNTLGRFESVSPRAYHNLGQTNLQRWENETGLRPPTPPFMLFVEELDWGEMTLKMTKNFGKQFAVLNAANAYWPGGGYALGAAGDEAEMFRQTDCHFSLSRSDVVYDTGGYRPEFTALIEARDGHVYLDLDHPRVCIRGPERIRTLGKRNYQTLPNDEIFLFYELRAAPMNMRELRHGEQRQFDELMAVQTRQRITAILQTLIDNKMRHVVFGAFGCGVCGNPAGRIARIFREALTQMEAAIHFDVVAFGIHDPADFREFHREFVDILSPPL